MDDRWRVLILEDNPDDVTHITNELTNAGLGFVARVASSKHQFETVIGEFTPDLVLSKYSLPGFTCQEALRRVRTLHHAIPFIVVSEPIGEDIAARSIREGATDFVLKGRLDVLPDSVRTALVAFEDQLEREQDNALAYSRLRSLGQPSNGRGQRANLKKHVRVLAVEDEEDDLALLEIELNKIPGSHTLLAVEKRSDFVRALNEFEPDIIIADFSVPGFDGITALGLRNDICPEVPFILTSGILSEELAMESLKHGVTDYVQKGSNRRLFFTLQRALSEAGEKADRERAESNLKRSELMFRQLAENLGAALWIASFDLNKLFYVNRAYEKIWGQPAESLYKKPLAFLDPIHQEDKERLLKQLADGKADNIDEHVRILRQNGDMSWVWMRTFPISSSGFQLNRLCGLAQDITQWKTAQLQAEGLQMQQAALLDRLQLQMDRMPLACILHDADFLFEYWNPAAERIFGFTLAEVKGRHPKDILLPPDMHDFVINEIFPRLRKGDMSAHGQGPVFTKDGRRIICQFHNTPLISPDGKFIGTLSMVEDVTERMETEKKLRVSEATYREIFEAVNDCIFVHDIETGVIVDVNQRTFELFGYSREQIFAGQVELLSKGEPPYTQKEANEWLRKAATEGPQVFAWLCKNTQGQEFWVEVNIKKATIAGRDRLLAIVRDLSQRRDSPVDKALSLE
ncbi:MAG TPA: PAS domain S-box protein [Candidatus Obscuribacterales bacterium]